MPTAGFDFVVELNERFVNRALSAAFYTTSIPDAVSGHVRGVEYIIKLNEPPTVDTFVGNTIRVLFYAKATLKKFGFTFEFDVKAYVDASPTYNPTSRELTLNLKQAKVEDIKIGDKDGWFKIIFWRIKLPSFILNLFNTVLAAVINSGVLDKAETVDVSPIVHSLDLPEMPPGPGNQLTIALGNIKILNQNVMATCVNFLEYTGGNIAHLTDFSGGLDFCCGVSEAAMHRVFDFWWNKTTHPKTVTNEASSDIPVLADLLSFLANIGFDLTVELASLGILETDFAVDRAWIDYGATVKFGRPSFNLLAGNRIELTNCPLQIHASATPNIKITVSTEVDTSGPIPDFMTAWEDDITIMRWTTTITCPTFTIDLNINIDHAEAKVYLDDQNRLMAEVQNVDITINLPWSLPQDVLNLIINWIIDLVIDKIPPIPLSPAVITEDVPGTNLTLKVDIDRLTTNANEAVVGASLSFEQMKENVIPVPKFIVDIRPSISVFSTGMVTTPGAPTLKGLVHRSDCALVHDILERNKGGVYVLADALRAGYMPCAECLPEYQHS